MSGNGCSDSQSAVQSRYQQPSAIAREMLKTQGESERCEFKRTAAAVNATVLVAAANWVALSPHTRDKVTVLVGVDENTDPATGLVSGQVVGLKGDLHKHVETIQNHCRDTHPVPVGLRIFEEGVATTTPFLRLEIWPTLAPHFDSGGRRIVRNNASTRALVDEELLNLYLDREAARFEQRFQQTATHLLRSLEILGDGVDRVAELLTTSLPGHLEELQGVTWNAVEEAEESKSLTASVAEKLDDEFKLLQISVDRSPVEVFIQLRKVRVRIWRLFSEDAVVRPTNSTDRLLARLREQLERSIDPNDWPANWSELDFWGDVVKKRGVTGTMTGWRRTLTERERLKPLSTIPLTDEIGRLREHFHALGARKAETSRRKRTTK